ncbi:MAG TPA: DUF1553 domain-containing protein [Planctomycetota bacterium]|nr:DUF1553 domain-containing protein [Planctomycetota bacterium]
MATAKFFHLNILSLLALAACGVLKQAHAGETSAPSAEGIEFFEKKIRPVLAERCYGCHSEKSEKLKGSLRLDTRETTLKGGDTGPAVVPGSLEKSLLITAIRYKDDNLLMPPKKKLSDEQIADFEAWVKMGAPDPRTGTVAGLPLNRNELGKQHWAFQPVKNPPVPAVKNSKWVQTPVDNFVLAKLEEKNLQPSAAADKRTLIRRAKYDLLGLPPTAEEVSAFQSDNSPDAYAKLIERLLASPQYGERWGRYWLDIARYADTKGYVFEEERRYPYAYTYRDYVIRALNEDLPYDQFLIQQIAADRLNLGDDKRPLAAMGFLTLGRRFLNNQADIIDDRIDVLCRGTMALTVSCARCHDHKFDPIPTKDYYSLYAVFASSKEPGDPPLINSTGPKSEQTIAFEKEVAAKQKKVDDFKQKRYAEHLAKANQPEMRAQCLALAQETLKQNNKEARKAAEAKKLDTFGLAYFRQKLKEKKDPASLKDEVITLTLDEAIAFIGGDDDFFNGDDKKKIRDLVKEVDAVRASHPGAPPRAMAMEDLATPVKQRVFKRGNPGMPGDEVQAKFLSAVPGPSQEPFKNGSGRLELAQSIASKDNPLTARVMVNRVWLWHFGQGLVRTPSDFGIRTEKPTHPELLDYLSRRFMDEGWSLKKLHRWIMLSSTYQQSSEDNPQARAVDPENNLVWRYNRRRLDFESLRDSLLAVSGQLDLTMGGRAVDLQTQPFSGRRTIYGFIDRQNLPSMFRVFDFASPDSHSPMRFNTTVPQQALFMMNSPFVVERARQVLNRPDLKDEKDSEKRIQNLYQTIYGRAASSDEVAMGLEFIKQSDPLTTEAAKPAPPVWSYGYGAYDQNAKKVTKFTVFPHFTGSVWQCSGNLPDSKLGWVLLNAQGGHPGNDDAHAAIRRWTAPADGAVSISGRLGHKQKDGNGVLGRIVSSREGEKAWWTLHNGETATKIDRIEVKKGDTIDFIVEPRGDTGYDGFTWAPVVKLLTTPPPGEAGEWNAATDFSGKSGKKMDRLTTWEKYAQVLLETNEFAFVD